MRTRGRSSAGRWALGALLVVALVGGVAWAETQVVATPPGQDVTVVAVLVPGPGGGAVSDDKGDDHIQFSHGGDIVVNGEVCAGHSVHDTYTVTFAYRHEMGLVLLDITVENSDTGELVYMDVGHPVGGMPGSVSATGEQVISLTAAQ